MKLRNKKTGEIKSIEEIIRDAFLSNELDSLKSIDTNWEDVDVTNATNIPLIKDKKIRKVVRAWADIVPESEFRYNRFERKLYTISKYILPFSISFPTNLDLIEMKDYTLEELCGEEEE